MYTVTQIWHDNTSKAGKKEAIAESVSITSAEDALMRIFNKEDDCMVSIEDGEIYSGAYGGLIWKRGDGSLLYCDYTISIQES